MGYLSSIIINCMHNDSIQTTIEELLFRGYLLQGIKRRLGSNIQAVVLSGFFWGSFMGRSGN